MIDKINLNKSKLLTIVLPFFFFIIFHRKIEFLLNYWFINDWFSQVNSSKTLDILFIISNLIILFICIKRLKLNFITSPYRILFVLFLLSIYSYYRFATNTYSFTSYTFLKYWKYLDIIIVFTLSEISVFIWQVIRVKNFNNSQESLFEIDDPIQVKTEDLLNRATLSIELANKIIGTNGNTSIAIGITGKWGSGKTSFMNLLKEQFKNHQDIIIDFNPWKSLNHETLIRDFFAVLSSQLEKYSITISIEINEYARELLKANDQSWSQGVKSLLKLDNSIDLNDRFRSINETLRRLNKNVIIIIDDVDRLDEKEIIELLKLIRNTGSFNRIKFIVAFDRDYVISSIALTNAYSPSKYLDKIFLQMIELPPINCKELIHLLSKKLSQHFPEAENRIEYMFEIDYYNDPSYMEKIITSIRDVKRFIIHFVPDYRNVVGEVEFDEYFKLSLLHYKFPSVYWEIYLNPSIYLQNSGHLKKTSDKLDSDTIIQKTLETETIKFSFDSQEIRTLMKLITNVFPDKSYTDNADHLSVRRRVNFDKYFISRLNSNDLSEIEFQEAIRGELVDLKKAIDQWCYDSKKFLVLLRFKALNIYDLDSKDDFEKIILAIIYLGSVKNRITDRTMIGYGYSEEDFYYKLSDRSNQISNKFYNEKDEEYKQFLLSIFKTAKSPYLFLAEFTHYMVRHEHLDSLPISKNGFVQIALKYFKSYLESIHAPDDRIWDLYHCCNTFSYNNNEKFTVPNKEANKVFKEYIFKNSINLKWFIRSITIKEARSQNHFYLSEITRNIFETYNQFKVNFCSSKILEPDYKEEFEIFLDKFIEANHKAIIFDFKIVLNDSESLLLQ